MDVNDIKTTAVIGAGTMGPGMGAVLSAHGYDTRLTDIEGEVLKNAEGTVETVFNTLLSEGFLSESQVNIGREKLSFTLNQAEAVDGAQFVIEAIPERLELKQDLFREIESQVSADTILASNTSGIPITKLCEVCEHRERVIGMHWSNPPHIIPVVEVIRGEGTGDRAVEATTALTEAVGMIPVLVKQDVPGFVENRILYAIMREALHLLEGGVASAEDIDTVAKWGIGYKLSVIGPLELLDMAGLDIYNSVAGYLNADLSASDSVSQVITDRVEQGTLGIKTGGGLFDYEPHEIPDLMQRRMRLLLAVKKALLSANGA